MKLQSTTNCLAFPQLFIQHTFSRYGLLLLNLIFLTAMVLSIADIISMLRNTNDDTEAIEKIIEGLATLFVAYGVALEEREFLMKIIMYYPQNQTSRETYLDHISHHYGVLLLIVGLVIEVGVQLIKMSDRFVDVISFELAVDAISLLCLLIIGYWLICFSYKLVNSARLSSSPTMNT